jgi:hypothetical protein
MASKREPRQVRVPGQHPSRVGREEVEPLGERRMLRGQADALYRMGVALRLTDDNSAARAGLQGALTLYRRLGNDTGETNTAVELALLRPA